MSDARSDRADGRAPATAAGVDRVVLSSVAVGIIGAAWATASPTLAVVCALLVGVPMAAFDLGRRDAGATRPWSRQLREDVLGVAIALALPAVAMRPLLFMLLIADVALLVWLVPYRLGQGQLGRRETVSVLVLILLLVGIPFREGVENVVVSEPDAGSRRSCVHCGASRVREWRVLRLAVYGFRFPLAGREWVETGYWQPTLFRDGCAHRWAPPSRTVRLRRWRERPFGRLVLGRVEDGSLSLVQGRDLLRSDLQLGARRAGAQALSDRLWAEYQPLRAELVRSDR